MLDCKPINIGAILLRYYKGSSWYIDAIDNKTQITMPCWYKKCGILIMINLMVFYAKDSANPTLADFNIGPHNNRCIIYSSNNFSFIC